MRFENEPFYYDIDEYSSLLNCLRDHDDDDTTLAIIELLLEDDWDTTCMDIDFGLNFAVRRPTMTIAKRLIQLGANVNFQDEHGWTPLHCAIDAYNLEAVCMLLYYDVDVSLCCENLCPLFRAIFYRRLRIIRVLVDYCFDEPVLRQAVLCLTTLETRYPINQDFTCYTDLPDVCRWGDICGYIITIYNTYDTFKALCQLIDTENLTSTDDFFIHYLRYCCYNPHQLIQCLLALLDSPISSWMIDFHYKKVQFPFTSNYLVSKLISYCMVFNVQQSDWLALFYTCTSLGFDILPRDFRQVYYHYGYNAELESLIYAGNLDVMYADYPHPFSTAAYILFFRSTLSHIKLVNYLLTEVGEYILIDAFNYFSMPILVKFLFMERACGETSFRITVMKLNKLPDVPSLVQLCRDEVRKHLIKSGRYKKAYEYLDAVKRMGLSRNIQDIILFKKAIYA